MSELIPPTIAAQLRSGQRSSNLAFALLFLPRERRTDALTFYRFCRIVDDIADSVELPVAEKSRTLDAWQSALSDHPDRLPADLQSLIATHQLDRHLLNEIVTGVRMDLTHFRYATFADLERYCWRVASAVGLCSARIFRATDPATPAYAESLGLALQLTNILRDVREDATLGRIYLPAEDLDRFEIAESDLLNARPTRAFVRLATFQADRADQYYRQATAALPAADRPALRPAEIMRRTYQRLLNTMRADRFRVLEKRYRLPLASKIYLALTTR